MFTGIVDHCGSIGEIVKTPSSIRLGIQCHFKDLSEGESVCVDGACLTVLRPSIDFFECDVSSETIHLTVVAGYRQGSVVNLERALRPLDRMGGHFVTGHIDQTCRLERRIEERAFSRLFFSGILPSSMRYLLKKGSVAVNGVSLTVNEVASKGFEVMLIPHTLEKTNLRTLREDELVNVEFDSMAKLLVGEMERLFRSQKEV